MGRCRPNKKKRQSKISLSLSLSRLIRDGFLFVSRRSTGRAPNSLGEYTDVPSLSLSPRVSLSPNYALFFDGRGWEVQTRRGEDVRRQWGEEGPLFDVVEKRRFPSTLWAPLHLPCKTFRLCPSFLSFFALSFAKPTTNLFAKNNRAARLAVCVPISSSHEHHVHARQNFLRIARLKYSRARADSACRRGAQIAIIHASPKKKTEFPFRFIFLSSSFSRAFLF